MKKFWIGNLLLTLTLLIILVTVNRIAYGTPAEQYATWALFILQIIQLLVSAAYALYSILKRGLSALLPAALSIAVQALALLFLFNGFLWDTDTGAFRIFP